MPSLVIVGAQWGDEGKGKIVDYFAEKADMVVRFQGGNNAGHTIVVDGVKYKLRFFPSGVVRKKKVILGNGMVLEPRSFVEELNELLEKGIMPDMLISERAHIITQKHLDEDGKDSKIGTTKRGIGPAYTDKVARKGIRVLDVLKTNQYPEFTKAVKDKVGDVSIVINRALDSGKFVLFEGAQATHLDIDHGTYPFVTSSNTVAGFASVGSGVGPTKLDKIMGIVKAYTTRVGEGPFPTELKDQTGEQLREKGQEFGTVTGRPRRCGWLDAVMVKYSVRINGISELAVTKLDILDGLKEVKICKGYELEGKILSEFPADLDILAKCKPIYETLPGWEKTEGMAKFKDLPKEAKNYLKKIEQLCGAKVKLVGTGASREELVEV